MANLTIIVADKILQAAKIHALEQNTTVNIILCQYLEYYSSSSNEPTSINHKWHQKFQQENTPNNTLSKDVPGIELLKFAGCIEADELQLMSEAIEAECRKVDSNEW